MSRRVIIICVVVSIQFASLLCRASTTDDSTFYTAGVVEFEPAAVNQPSLDQVNENLRGYLEILTSPEAEKTDIIVFPELTLNNVLHYTYIPDPKSEISPCNNEDFAPFLQELSCAVNDVKKYVVVNLLEKENCTAESQVANNDPRPCASNGLNIFNTNVVFNRDGVVVSRYRKFNLFGEQRNTTYQPELSIFDTDFGVRFGMFICFDILFYSPASDLVKMGVTDLIYSSFWYSELPFLTAVQIQHSWAYANEVNLLAAGASYPSVGSTGSGIYAGKGGTLVSTMARVGERKLYVANVTKSSSKSASTAKSINKTIKPAKRSLNGLELMREYKMDAYSSEHIDLTEGLQVEKHLCHDSFCCNFSLKLRKLSPPEGTSSYQYHVAVYDGDRHYVGNVGYTRYRLCAVYACTNKSLESCGRVFDDGTFLNPELSFEAISIEGDFPKTDKVLIMPSTLDQDLYPLENDQFEFKMTNAKSAYHVTQKLIKESKDLLTFGIYANYFDEKSGSSAYSSPLAISVLASVLVLAVVRLCLM